MTPPWKKSGRSFNADAQLLPNTTNAQPFNQMSAPQPNAATPQTSTAQPQQKKETKKKFDGQCHHCGIHGHKWVECRKRLREEAQAKPSSQTPQQPTQATRNPDNRQKYNSKLVCQICGKVGHTARDCYHRNTTTSAYKKVPCTKLSTEKNKQFRRDKTTTGSTTPMSSTTLPTTSLMKMEKWNNTMTCRPQKTSKATSSKSTKQKCAPKSKTTDYYSKTTNNSKLHGVAVPSFNLY